MKTRKEKIDAMTRYELQYLLDNPEWLEDNVLFFAKGGFTTYTDENINQHYQEQIDEGMEP
jgi:hypothetical protein